MNCIEEETDVGIECELIVAGNIKDLLHMRDTHDKFFMKDQMQCMLDYCSAYDFLNLCLNNNIVKRVYFLFHLTCSMCCFVLLYMYDMKYILMYDI